MENAKPQKEHQWLKKLVGEWRTEFEMPGENGQPPTTLHGTESVRAIGDLWVMGEGRGEMPGGGTANMFITLGYDPEKRHYVGTWFGSMMTYLWVYKGSVDAAGKALTLETEGPAPDAGGEMKMAKIREVIEFVTDDHRTFTSNVLGADGKWSKIMQAHYYRKK